jgi:hypothetical protein
MMNPKMPMDLAEYIPPVAMPSERSGLRFEVLGEGHSDGANQLFNQVFGQSRPLSHYAWKFWKNPAGPPVGMVAIEEATDRVVACNSGIVRRFQVNGREVRTMFACESAVDPSFRGGGFLFRAVTGGMVNLAHKHGVCFAYGGQSTDEAIRIGRRLFRYQDLFELRAYDRILSSRPALQGRLGKTGDSISDLLPRARLKASEVEEGWDFETHSEFNSEFDNLWVRLQSQFEVCTIRDSRHLNWRWRDCPIGSHFIVSAHRNGAMMGYLVFRIFEKDRTRIALVLDLFVDQDSTAAAALLSHATSIANQNRADVFRIAICDEGCLSKALNSLSSFKLSKREVADRVIGTAMWFPDGSLEDYESQRQLLKGESWYYTQGDADFLD